MRFTRGVLVGNWSEDRSLEDERGMDFEARKSRGDLMIKQRERLEAIALQRVPWSHSSDGTVRFGDSVMFSLAGSDESGRVSRHFLASNIWEEVNRINGTVQATATPKAGPTARSVFVVMRRPAAGLRADPATGVVAPPYFLASDRPNNVIGSGAGVTQDVFLAPRAGTLTEWRFAPADGNDAAWDGSPVPAGAEVCLVHCQTNQALAASETAPIATAFGRELPLYARTHKSSGIVTRDRPRPAQAPNRWAILLSEDAAAAEDRRDFRPLTADAIVDKVRLALRERGTYGIRALGKAFRILDDRRDGRLDREDLKWGLFDFGLRLSDEEFEMLLDAVDTSGDGLVSYDEFLLAVRGPMNERRRAVVEEAFRKLDRDGSGEVTAEDLAGVFSAKFDEGVRAGTRTEAQALREFLSQWDTLDADGRVTLDEFCRYYDDVSASVDSDDYFETMVRKCWRLPGADVAASAAGLARGKWVEVRLKSGARKDVFLEGLDSVPDSDKRAIMDALDDEGIFGVADVRALPERGVTAAAE
ncbi:hypothetical protein FNF28_07855 [Cafeteria roenbergensis]|uniref:EF-hand domain-containing protein n=1 Tax=Cafeteria roenbergensis TaxID=33653 RepID=A0A5A8BXW9_CAFRO|nr:hypothetical protein FNF28_07855 [Cafeteria roenbergensis]